jgi:hypothetical protein
VKHLRLVCCLTPFVLAWCSPIVFAQKATQQWLRVITGEESIIEVDRTSLTLEPKAIIQARFRTTVTTPEQVPGKAELHFRSRIDEIQFDLDNNRYRIAETIFLNANTEKIYTSSTTDDKDWKPMSGNTAFKLRGAAQQLAPFGSWNISSYRYPLGGSPSDSDPPEVKSLVGSKMSLLFENVRGPTICSVRDFEPFEVDNQRSTQLFGRSLTALKINFDKVPAIRFKCATSNEAREEAVMLLLAPDKALILWNGVFLEAERSGNMFLP